MSTRCVRVSGLVSLLLLPIGVLGCNRRAPPAGNTTMEGGDAARTNAHVTSGVPSFGRVVWRRGAKDGDAFSGSPVVLDGVVYAVATAAADSGHPSGLALLAMDAQTGAVRWRFPMEGRADRATPAATRDIVYAATSDGTLYAVRADTGKLAWRHRVATPPDLGRIFDRPVLGGPRPPLVTPTPRLSGKLVHLGGWAGYHGMSSAPAFAIDADTGRLRWSDKGGAGAIAEDTLFVQMEAGVLLALDASTGKQRWVFRGAAEQEDASTRSFAASAESTGTVVSAGTAYFGYREGLYAVDARTGQLRWRSPHHLGGATPAVSGGRLYFRSGGRLHALDASTGASVWTSTACAETHSNSWPPPAIAGGMMYVSTVKRLCVADAATGAERWTFGPSAAEPRVANAFWTTPAIADGAVYVVSGTELYAIDGVAGAERPASTAAPTLDPPRAPRPAPPPTPEQQAAMEAQEQQRARQYRRPLFHLSPGGVVLAATPDGVLRSRDDGRTWESANQGLEARATIAFASSPTGATFALTDHGLFLSEGEDTARWKAIGSSPDGGHWEVSSAARRLFVDRTGRLIVDWMGLPWVSTDMGQTWLKLSIPMMERLRSAHAMAMSPEGDFYISPMGLLLQSTAQGEWKSLMAPEAAMGVGEIWPLREGRLLLEGQPTAVRGADGTIVTVTWPAPATARRMIAAVVETGAQESYALVSEYAKGREGPTLRVFRLRGATFTALPDLPVCPSADADTRTVAPGWRSGLGRTRAGDLLFSSSRCIFRSTDRAATWVRTRGP